METIVFGRTGLTVSVAGLGCGGHSRLGQTAGASEEESIRVVRRAMELGITYIDTARAYGTEEIVGKAIAGHRDDVVVSTKAHPLGRDGALDTAGLRDSLHLSLRRLQTDCVDVFHLHGVTNDDYDHCASKLAPEMVRMRDQGLIRFLAISERFGADPGHSMLPRALEDDFWDVVMVGFNPLNPCARERVFPSTIRKDVAVEIMFAVRRVLSQPDELRKVVLELVEQGQIGADGVDPDDPLGFLVHEGGAQSVVDASYRFARHEPGCHVVLTGTGNVEHLEQNVASINRPPLPDVDLGRLRTLFGHLDHLSGN